VYIAGCFEDKNRLARVRDTFVAAGHTVTSSWLDEPDQEGPIKLPSAADCIGLAVRDCAEIEGSDALLVDEMNTNTRAGREVEFGMAFAWGKRVATVGPRRNVFHFGLPNFATWEEALRGFDKV